MLCGSLPVILFGVSMLPTPFDEWRKQVDRIIRHRIGLTADDLPDYDYWQAWYAHMSAARCAREAIKNAATMMGIGHHDGLFA